MVNGVRAEQVGYRGYFITGEILLLILPIRSLFWLESAGVMLDELMVYGADPRLLMENAIKKIPSNYSSKGIYFLPFIEKPYKKVAAT